MVRTPLNNRKNIGFPSNIGPNPLKITKLPSQHSMLGHHPAKRHLNGAGGLKMAAYSGIWILPPLTNFFKKVVTKLSGYTYGHLGTCNIVLSIHEIKSSVFHKLMHLSNFLNR